MENRPLSQEEQDDATEESSSKKKRGLSRLSQFLSGVRNKEREESVENDVTDEKPKRFRRLFSKLFPSVVEDPNQEIERQHQFDPESWFNWMRPVEVEASTSESEKHPDVTPSAVSADSTHEQSHQAVPPREETTQLAPHIPSEAHERVPTVEDMSAVPEGPIEVPLQSTEQELYNREQPTPEAPSRMAEAASVAERPEKETVIERGPGMVLPVALVGLEYLGRKKADKKLESRVNQKISATTQEVNRNAALQQELETLTRQNQAQLETLKRARENEVGTLLQEAVQAEKPALDRAVVPEVPRQASVEKPVAPSNIQERAKQEEIQPEKILEQVADAAEHNIAVERVFERSHEVKDDQAMPGAATSVGAVMADRTGSMPYKIAQPIGAQPPTLLDTHKEVTAEVYRQAMKSGFWAAIAIIVLGSLAYLMIK
jgi:hypothetical protein